MNKICSMLLFLFLIASIINDLYARQSLVIRDVNLITMIDDSVQYNKNVVIRNNKIYRILDNEQEEEFESYTQIDGTGKFLIPGLFDMHMHFVSDDRIDSKYLTDESFIPLAYGVTGARIMIGTPEHLELRKQIETGEALSPKLYIASPQITGISLSEILNGQVVKSYDAGYNAVIDYKRQGYDFIKLTFDVNMEAYRGVIEAAKEVNLKVVGHISRDVKLEKSLESGQDVEHLDQYLDAILSEQSPTKTGLSAFGLFRENSWETVNYIDSLKLENILRKTVENNIWNTPTNFFFLSSFAIKKTDNELKSSPEWNWFSEEVRNELLKYREPYWESPAREEYRKRYIDIRSYIIRELFKRSGKILAGSDAPEWLNLYGTGLHRELQNFVDQVGLTPFEALQTATVKPAENLGLSDHGKIQPGFVGDLVLLNANPLNDIRNTTKIEGIIYQGRYLGREFLTKRLEQSIKNLKEAECTCN